MAQHPARLVGLQAADEMPVERPEIGQGLLLGDRLLQPTFGEAALAEGHGAADGLSRLPLAHRQDPGRGGQPPAQFQQGSLKAQRQGEREVQGRAGRLLEARRSGVRAPAFRPTRGWR